MATALLPSPTEWPGPVIDRMDTSSPQDDLMREQARYVESIGMSPHAALSPVTTTTTSQRSASSPQPSTHSPAQPVQRRQDFSHEKLKKETRLGNYMLGRTLGEGEFGKVKLGWKHGGGAQVAVKIIRKDKLQDHARVQKVFREVKILQGLHHPNIVRLHETVETERAIGLVLEYAPCGELFNFILNQRYLKDPHAKKLFAQLVSAVGYLHRRGIIHRDLKLENLLLDRNYNIIVTDFGFANIFDPNDELGDEVEANLNDRDFVEAHGLGNISASGLRRGDLMATSCGSPCYAAPELVISDGLYTARKVDVWSLGVILFAMLAGYLPYDDDPRNPEGDNINLLYQYISETDLKFPDYVTPHARDLLKRILRPDPRQRADLFEVARHSWLSGFEDVVDSVTSTSRSFDAERMGLTRSASAREPSKPIPTPSPGSTILSRPGQLAQNEAARPRPTQRQDNKRATVQVEYMPPLNPAQASPEDWYIQQPAVVAEADRQRRTEQRRDDQWYAANVPAQPQAAASQGRPRPPAPTSTPVTNSMPPPPRPTREVPRSISDSPALTLGQISSQRPATQGSVTAGSRLPSRGSYGQPVAAQVAPTNAEGRFSQPRPAPQPKDSGVADVSGHHNANAEKRFSWIEGSRPKRTHSRSNTLSDLTSKVFGRTPSTSRKTQDTRPRPDRAFPPVSMKSPTDSPSTSRKSTDSRTSFAFRRSSIDKFGDARRSSRRFSFLQRFNSSSKDMTPPQTAEPMTTPTKQPATAHGFDGSFDRPFERPAPPRTRAQHAAAYEPALYTSDYAGPRAASAGNPSIGQPRIFNGQYGQSRTDSDPSSRFASPALPHDARAEKVQQSQAGTTNANANLSQAKKLQSGGRAGAGAAQRVMDFFRGRRHERSGMA